MKQINLTVKILLSMAFSLVIASGFAQGDKELEPIKNYLESTIMCNNEVVVSSTTQNVTASDIIESSLRFNSGDEYGGYTIITSKHFLKSDGKFIPFDMADLLFSSEAFMESMKAKNFALNSKEDGLAFQSILKLIDDERGLGFFEEGGTWYFVRSTFFDDVSGYVVETNDENQVISIIYHDNLEQEQPETLLQVGEFTRFDSAGGAISEQDSAFMHNYLVENIDYMFEVTPLDLNSVKKISTLDICKCNLKITEVDEEEGYSSTMNNGFFLIDNKGEYIKQSSIDNLIGTQLSAESLQEKYQINGEEDALLFQNLLDDLAPVGQNDITLKKFYKRDNMWVYVRDEFFDDLQGYILLLDEDNRVAQILYETISEKTFLRVEMMDANFVGDYKFELVSPTTNKITVNRRDGVSVEISFDADMVNAKGAWITAFLDGHRIRTYAGTSLESPYRHVLRSEALENESHTLEYFLMENVDENTEAALAEIKIEVTVEE